jgi:hypothetical protein
MGTTHARRSRHYDLLPKTTSSLDYAYALLYRKDNLPVQQERLVAPRLARQTCAVALEARV